MPSLIFLYYTIIMLKIRKSCGFPSFYCNFVFLYFRFLARCMFIHLSLVSQGVCFVICPRNFRYREATKQDTQFALRKLLTRRARVRFVECIAPCVQISSPLGLDISAEPNKKWVEVQNCASTFAFIQVFQEAF